MCQICINEPGSHSFYLLKSENNVNTYYTCPSKATKYWDTEGIIDHYDGVLTANGETPWIWIFDSTDFGFVHSMQIGVALGILNLLKDKYGKYLQEIQIINPTPYIKTLYSIIYPFLTNEIINTIRWL